MPQPRHIPAGMTPVTPHLVCNDAAAAIEFYKKAFNAIEELRIPTPDGKLIHASVRIAGSPVMLVDEFPGMGGFSPRTLKGSPVTIHVYVEDVDALVAQATQAGAKVTMPPADMFWGDRYGMITDPFGHQWSIATPVRTLSAAEIQEASKTACCGDGCGDG